MEERHSVGKEKLIKEMTKEQKEALIAEINPTWRFLNEDICGMWPPNAELLEALGKEEAEDGV